MREKVSIVMPSYNSEEFIAESINSVLAQTYENFELLIVDDCSTDKTVENKCKNPSSLQVNTVSKSA